MSKRERRAQRDGADDLLGEQCSHVRKRLQLECIARRVEEEHRRLLADLTFESNVRFDDELNLRSF